MLFSLAVRWQSNEFCYVTDLNKRSQYVVRFSGLLKFLYFTLIIVILVLFIV